LNLIEEEELIEYYQTISYNYNKDNKESESYRNAYPMKK